MNFSIRPDFNTRVDYQTRQASIAKIPAVQVENAKKPDTDTESLSGGNKIAERCDEEALSKATADSIRVGASDKKVAELHQQVQSGAYRPNARRIAEKLLGYKD